MTFRRSMIFELASVSLLLVPGRARAQAAHVVELDPAANAVVDGRTTAFYVRFDRPVDHVRSLLLIKRGDEVIETLQPRLDFGAGSAIRTSTDLAARQVHVALAGHNLDRRPDQRRRHSFHGRSNQLTGS